MVWKQERKKNYNKKNCGKYCFFFSNFGDFVAEKSEMENNEE